MKKITPLLAALLATIVTLPVTAQAEMMTVHADLSSKYEVPPKSGNGQGELKGTYDTSSKLLKWHVVYANLTGPATMAHFHGPAPVGKNAGVAIPIPADKVASPIDGDITLNGAQEKDLLAGNYYFNVHTAANPGGEIRGQVEATQH
jgi:hypothetical protein